MDITVPFKGSNCKGVVIVQAEVQEDKWEYENIYVDIKDTNKRYILGNNGEHTCSEMPIKETSMFQYTPKRLLFYGIGLMLPILSIVFLVRAQNRYAVVQLVRRSLSQSEHLKQILGSPIKSGKSFEGEVTKTYASFVLRLTGPNGEGELKIQSIKTNHKWILSSSVLRIPGREKGITINLKFD